MENQNPTPIAPVQNPNLTSPSIPNQTPPATRRKSKMIYVLIILFVLFMISTTVIGLKYFQGDKKDEGILVPPSSPTPTTKPDPTANWKTYTRELYTMDLPPHGSDDAGLIDEEYGYNPAANFDNPNRWLLVVSHPNVSEASNTVAWNLLPGDFIPQLMKIQVGKTGKIYDTKSKTNYSFTREADIPVAGETARIYNSNYYTQNGKYTKYALLQKDDHYFIITFEWTNPSNKNLFYQILSTFKFTPSTHGGTKSYSNSKYSYEYPSDFYVYSYHDANSCTAVSNIPNPADIPAKVLPENQTVVQICAFNDVMPKSFPYTNGFSTNATIKPYTSIQGYIGIRGQQTSEAGISENVFIKNSNDSYASIQSLLGNKQVFEQVLSSFKFK